MSTVLQWTSRAIVLLTTAPIHECAHGWVACKLGDDTAKQQGRLTLNPFKHLDLLGSLLLIFVGFGWAKPVQINSRKFKNPKWGMALAALAGPFSNVMMAAVLMVLLKILNGFSASGSLGWEILLLIIQIMLLMNLRLAVFNLLPIPPLDGSRILFAVLPDKAYYTVMRYERYIALGLMLLLAFTNVLSGPLSWLATQLLYLLDLLTFPLGQVT